MMRGGNREMRRMMDKMGLDMNELQNVQEVIIKTDKKEIIISKPSVTEMTVQVGKAYNTHYVMKNNSSKQLHTTASPSVTPGKHAEYFKKVECFCFEQQTINAGEIKDLGIQFIIDNDLPHASGDIILSYTMFDITDSVKETNRL